MRLYHSLYSSSKHESHRFGARRMRAFKNPVTHLGLVDVVGEKVSTVIKTKPMAFGEYTVDPNLVETLEQLLYMPSGLAN